MKFLSQKPRNLSKSTNISLILDYVLEKNIFIVHKHIILRYLNIFYDGLNAICEYTLFKL